MIKYGVKQEQVEALVKLGKAEERALEIVAEGTAEEHLKKEAKPQEKKTEEDSSINKE